MTASIPDLQLWLLEALLEPAPPTRLRLKQLLRLPELFPFGLSVVSPISADTRASPSIDKGSTWTW